MKKEFYTMVLKNNKNFALKVKGYVISTESNNFGIYKDNYNYFNIIDLSTGLSVNYLDYYKLKDFKKDIKLFDDKLNNFKNLCSIAYEKHKKEFNKLVEALEN